MSGPDVPASAPARWRELYGTFRTHETVTAAPITGLAKESGWIRPEIVELVDELRAVGPVTPLLLPGENDDVVDAYETWLDIERADVVTTGLSDAVDVRWDFEDPPPAELGRYACILSQAMIEHLLEPAKHVRDCYGLLSPGGVLVVHTVQPGFPYHRFPVDCLRFFPDWFEELGSRMGAEIVAKYVGELRIMYAYRRPR